MYRWIRQLVPWVGDGWVGLAKTLKDWLVSFIADSTNHDSMKRSDKKRKYQSQYSKLLKPDHSILSIGFFHPAKSPLISNSSEEYSRLLSWSIWNLSFSSSATNLSPFPIFFLCLNWTAPSKHLFSPWNLRKLRLKPTLSYCLGSFADYRFEMKASFTLNSFRVS